MNELQSKIIDGLVECFNLQEKEMQDVENALKEKDKRIKLLEAQLSAMSVAYQQSVGDFQTRLNKTEEERNKAIHGLKSLQKTINDLIL